MQNNSSYLSKVSIGLFLIISFLFLQSCGTIFNLALGVKKPQKDSIDDQIKYLSKIHLDTNYLFFANEISYDLFKTSIHDPEKQTKLHYIPLHYRMYDKNGKCINTWHTCISDKINEKSLSVYPPIPNSYTSIDFHFKEDIILFSDSNFNPVLPEKYIGNYDLIIVVFWDTYSGNPCKNMLISLQNYVKKHSDKKIAFLKVNISLGYGKVKLSN